MEETNAVPGALGFIESGIGIVTVPGIDGDADAHATDGYLTVQGIGSRQRTPQIGDDGLKPWKIGRVEEQGNGVYRCATRDPARVNVGIRPRLQKWRNAPIGSFR